MNIDVHIDELVLHGVPPGDRYAVGEALTAELSRLFSSRGMPDTLQSNVESLRTHAAAGTQPLGIRAANAVYDGMAGNG